MNQIQMLCFSGVFDSLSFHFRFHFVFVAPLFHFHVGFVSFLFHFVSFLTCADRYCMSRSCQSQYRSTPEARNRVAVETKRHRRNETNDRSHNPSIERSIETDAETKAFEFDSIIRSLLVSFPFHVRDGSFVLFGIFTILLGLRC